MSAERKAGRAWLVTEEFLLDFLAEEFDQEPAEVERVINKLREAIPEVRHIRNGCWMEEKEWKAATKF